jgi:hypothetical protein
MPTFEITAPDGKKYDVTGDNAEGAYNALISMLGGNQAEQAPKPTPAPTEPYVDEQGVTRYPNLQQVESGAFEDIAGAGLAGMARGVKGLAETPEMLGRAVIRGGQELAQLAGAEIQNEMPVLDTTTGRGIEAALSTFGGDKAMAYRGESTPAQFAGTIGEFVGPGGILGGGKKLMQASVAAGAGSEAAGQATEGTEFEPYARIAGALISPYAANKTLSAFQKKNVTSPTLPTLKAEKNSAYDLLKSEGTGLTGTQTAYLVQDMRSVLNMDDIILSAKPSVEKALALVDEVEKSGAMNLSKFNELQKALGKIYRTAPDAPEVLLMLKKMDDVLADGSRDAALMQAAKAANSKYAKARMLDKYFAQATQNAKKGNLIPKTGEAFQAAATKILNNDRAAAFWSPDELAALKKVADGTIGSKVLATIGKLAPTSNGLTSGMSIALLSIPGNFAYEIMGMTAASFAKLGYNAKIKTSRKALEDLVRSGGVAEPSKVVTKELVQDIVARLSGLQAQELQ